jgi:integrase
VYFGGFLTPILLLVPQTIIRELSNRLFNDLKITRITTAKVEKFICEFQEQNTNLGTLKKIIINVGQIVTYAIKHKYIEQNPVRDAEMPKGRGTEKKKIRTLAPLEIGTLIESTKGQKYKMLFRMAIFSGVRQGELLGLKWTDVDWKNNQIHIQRSYNHNQIVCPKIRDVKSQNRFRYFSDG